MAFLALLGIAALVWAVAFAARLRVPLSALGGVGRAAALVSFLCAALALLLFTASARAGFRSGWEEGCIAGQQTYPANGVGTIGYCPDGPARFDAWKLPDASCSIYQAADFPGQSFSCGFERGWYWSPVTVASLPAPEEEGPGGGGTETGIDWGNPAHVGQVILFAMALGFGLHGYSAGARS